MWLRSNDWIIYDQKDFSARAAIVMILMLGLKLFLWYRSVIPMNMPWVLNSMTVIAG